MKRCECGHRRWEHYLIFGTIRLPFFTPCQMIEFTMSLNGPTGRRCPCKKYRPQEDA